MKRLECIECITLGLSNPVCEEDGRTDELANVHSDTIENKTMLRVYNVRIFQMRICAAAGARMSDSIARVCR